MFPHVLKNLENSASRSTKSRYFLEAIRETDSQRLLLPTCFSPSDKSPHVNVKEPALTIVEYKGPGANEADSAQIRSNHHVPLQAGLFYFEVTVVSGGREGYVALGLGTKDVRMNKLPGWERSSFGYHGDDGKKFRGAGTGEPYGPTYRTEDVVGCLVNYLDSTISFTKNGLFLGIAFKDVKDRDLYPLVGMRSEGAMLQLNCGHSPFLFNLAAYVQEERGRVRRGIRDTPQPCLHATACQALLAYLVHQGYPDTALALAQSCGREGDIEPLLGEMRSRREVLASILNGDISHALGLLRTLSPALLDTRPDLGFLLRCQNFLEMVKAGRDPAELLEYGTEELSAVYDCESEPSCMELEDDDVPPLEAVGMSVLEATALAAGESDGEEGEEEEEGDEEDEAGQSEEHRPIPLMKAGASGPCGLQAYGFAGPQDEVPPRVRRRLLEQVFSLLAYEDPKQSPHAYLLGDAMRGVLATEVNAALQGQEGWAAQPPLDRLVRQARAVLDRLGELSLVGLLLQDEVPLGHGDTCALSEAEQQVEHFYDALNC